MTTGHDGRATVELPEWFEALNRDFRDQLTVIGGGAWARARVAVEEAKAEMDKGRYLHPDAPAVPGSSSAPGRAAGAGAPGPGRGAPGVKRSHLGNEHSMRCQRLVPEQTPS